MLENHFNQLIFVYFFEWLLMKNIYMEALSSTSTDDIAKNWGSLKQNFSALYELLMGDQDFCGI